MNMKVLIEVLLYVWQLPKNLLGLLLRWLMWTKVQIIQGKLCDVLDNVFREDARWDQPRTLHRAPLPLSSLIIEHIRSENNSSRIWSHTAVALSRVAISAYHWFAVYYVSLAAFFIQVL